MSTEAHDGTLEVAVRLGFGKFTLDVDRRLSVGGITALFGPNASGKSTLLRILAGFERAAGRVALGDEVWLDSARRVSVPPHRRPVGYMFQDLRLFGHLSVAGNLRYAIRRQRENEGRVTFNDVVASLDLASLLDRRVGALSGGERQRVALGRTLLTHPRLLLLDEPLSALDADRKEEILPYLERLPRHFAVPTIYVSHSIDEVARLADRILVLDAGRVRALGPTVEIVERLDVQSLNDPYEAGVVVEARVSGHDSGYRLTTFDLEGESITTPMATDLPEGESVRLRIRARDVALATVRPQEVSIRNVLPGKIAEIVEDPDTAYAEVVVAVGRARLRARITRASVNDLSLAVGRPVFALIKSVTFDHRAQS